MAKDEASPQVRGAMERRWDEARKDCTAGTCPPAYRFHVKGCDRRRAFVSGDRKAADTPAAEATFPAAAPLAGVLRMTKLDADGQPTGKTITVTSASVELTTQQVGDDFEKELFKAMRDARGGKSTVQPIPLIITDEQVDQYAQSSLLFVPDGVAFPPPSPPARPWWKFWGRRG